jgi:hypothetical protein
MSTMQLNVGPLPLALLPAEACLEEVGSIDPTSSPANDSIAKTAPRRAAVAPFEELSDDDLGDQITSLCQSTAFLEAAFNQKRDALAEAVAISPVVPPPAVEPNQFSQNLKNKERMERIEKAKNKLREMQNRDWKCCGALKDIRIKQGYQLLSLHADLSFHGCGTFIDTLKELGYNPPRAYRYMDLALIADGQKPRFAQGKRESGTNPQKQLVARFKKLVKTAPANQSGSELWILMNDTARFLGLEPFVPPTVTVH